MDSYTLDVCGRQHGAILQNKTFVSLNGPILSVSNCLRQKSVSFVRAAWKGTSFAATDALGNVFVFHPKKNKFSLVCSLHLCSTFLTFTRDESQDILVALSDCSIVALSSESNLQTNRFSHHTSCVSYISFDKKSLTVLSSCKDQAILWDLKTFKIIRILTLKRDTDIIKAFLLPEKSKIVTSFNDNSVFFWDVCNFNCLDHFLCHSGEQYLNIKDCDASNDEKYLACAGKSDWFLVWDIEKNEKLCTISLPNNVASIKQIDFIPSPPELTGNYLITVLSADGEIMVYNITIMTLLHRMSSRTRKITSYAKAATHFQILTISLGVLELYDFENHIITYNEANLVRSKDIKPLSMNNLKASKKECKVEIKNNVSNVKKQNLILIVKKHGEYPEKHRFFIWSQLLQLPQNLDAYRILYQESLKRKPLDKNYSFMNPGVKKTFLSLMSMLHCWHPLLGEMDYFQCLLFPFVKVLHKSPVMCFELLISLISNWCHCWFLFSPFQPFNILCVVENILLYHDQELMLHFLQHKVTSKVFAWSLLKTSFSEALNKEEWLKLWDNIFSNDISFQLYAVAAFNIVMRNVLLQCTSVHHFKQCYTKHSISASTLIQKTYALKESSPPEIDPEQLIGKFKSIPKGAYPSLFQLSQFKVDLETLVKKRAIDKAVNFIKRREDTFEVKSNYLKELQSLQMLRRNLLIEALDLKDTKAMEYLDEKLKRVQALIQDNLSDQISVLKATVGEDMFSEEVDNENYNKYYFDYQDFVKKLMKNK